MNTDLTTKLIAFANTVRDALGHPNTDKVIAGVMGDASSCVLANSINCGLSVCYDDCGIEGAYILTESYDEASKLSAALNVPIHIDDPDYAYLLSELGGPEDWDSGFQIPFPHPDVAQIPRRFDNGEFPEWEEPDFEDDPEYA